MLRRHALFPGGICEAVSLLKCDPSIATKSKRQTVHSMRMEELFRQSTNRPGLRRRRRLQFTSGDRPCKRQKRRLTNPPNEATAIYWRETVPGIQGFTLLLPTKTQRLPTEHSSSEDAEPIRA